MMIQRAYGQFVLQVNDSLLSFSLLFQWAASVVYVALTPELVKWQLETTCMRLHSTFQSIILPPAPVPALGVRIRTALQTRTRSVLGSTDTYGYKRLFK